TRSSVSRNLTIHEDRTYNVAVLRNGQSELRFVQPRFQRTLPNQLFRCATDRAFYGDLASMEFLPNLSRSVESICNKSTICNCSNSTTVVLMEKAIAFCNDKTETWLDVAFANKTKPKYELTEQLVAKGLFPGAVALPEPSRASQSPAAFECSQALEGAPPLFSEVRRDSLCPHEIGRAHV